MEHTVKKEKQESHNGECMRQSDLNFISVIFKTSNLALLTREIKCNKNNSCVKKKK